MCYACLPYAEPSPGRGFHPPNAQVTGIYICTYTGSPIEHPHYTTINLPPLVSDRTTLSPQPPATGLQEAQDDQRSADDSGLDAETDAVPLRRAPRLLEVSDREAAHDTGEIEVAGDFGGGVGIGVEHVGGDGDRGEHDAEDVHAPAHHDAGVGEVLDQRLADDDQARDHEYRG